jgi:hypothetical protein
MLTPEIYPPTVKVYTSNGDHVSIQLSRTDTIAHLVEIACAQLNISEEAFPRLKLYEFSYSQKGRQYREPQKTLYEESVQDKMSLLLEDDANATPPTSYSMLTDYSISHVNSMV